MEVRAVNLDDPQAGVLVVIDLTVEHAPLHGTTIRSQSSNAVSYVEATLPSEGSTGAWPRPGSSVTVSGAPERAVASRHTRMLGFTGVHSSSGP